ncbi:unnamed protein product, partial [Cyprideis torosa]
MEINQRNFKASLPKVLKAIEESDYISFDTELTGLHQLVDCRMELSHEMYQRVIKGSLDFLVIQFGLCCFKWDAEKKGYSYACFSFSVFPNSPAFTPRYASFLWQASSVAFLVQHKFDFNEVIYNGIPYLNCVEAAKARDKLKDKQESRRTPTEAATPEGNANGPDPPSTPGNVAFAPSPNPTAIPIPEDKKEFIESALSQIASLTLDNGPDPSPVASDSKVTEVVLPRCGAFIRKLLYQEVPRRFPTVFLETKVSGKGERTLVARVSSREEIERKKREREEKEMEELEEAIGFSKVVEALSKSKKTLVGHNMFLDICHVLKKFHTPPPPSYSEFKRLVHSVFPDILDTKLVASSKCFESKVLGTTLGDLHDLLSASEPPLALPEQHQVSFFPQEEEVAMNLEANAFHHAGYDAFITGRTLALLCAHLGVMQSPSRENIVLPTDPLLDPFRNKLFLMLSDIQCCDLLGEDEYPSREHVFHLSFPAAWKTRDIVDLFKAFGRVSISWVDDNAAFVTLHDNTQVDSVLPRLRKEEYPSREHVFHLSFPAAWKTRDIVDLFKAFGRVSISWVDDNAAFVTLHDNTQVDSVLPRLRKE